MKVITRKPGERYAQVEEWETIELDAMQKAVDGLICAAVTGHGFIIWCDDEGLLKQLPEVNFYRSSDNSPIVGNILVTGHEDDEGDTQGLSDETVVKVLADLVRWE